MSEYWFDDDAVKHAIEFFPLFLKHLKGPLAGKPFELLPWQEKITGDLIGWKRQDGTRQYRTCFIAVPRKNGKSTWLAGLGLYLLACDNESSGEVYGAAYTRDQAAIIYDIATGMVEADPTLSAMLKVRKHAKRIIETKSQSVYRAIAAEAAAAHGFNASVVLFDEVHTQKDRELWDVLETSTGARTQPLQLGITTAGFDRASLCWDLWQKAKAINDGLIKDDTFYPCIFAADEEDDWTSPETWLKANPSMGYGVSEEYLRLQCERAQSNPAFENTFRRLHLNQWTEQETRLIQMHEWDKCKDESLRIEQFTGRTCYAGLDLASTRDVTAFVLVFPQDDGGMTVFPYFWIPRDNIDRRTEQDQRVVRSFAEKGHIEITDGNTVDTAYVAERIVQIMSPFHVRKIGVDPWNATGVTQTLESLGVPNPTLTLMPQSFGTYNEPIKNWLSMLANETFHHDGNQVLRWMASNAVGKSDASGNLRFDKGSSSEKIDGMSASAMGMALAIRFGGEEGVYNTAGGGVVLL